MFADASFVGETKQSTCEVSSSSICPQLVYILHHSLAGTAMDQCCFQKLCFTTPVISCGNDRKQIGTGAAVRRRGQERSFWSNFGRTAARTDQVSTNIIIARSLTLSIMLLFFCNELSHSRFSFILYRECWKRNQAVKHVFSWMLVQIGRPWLSQYLEKVFPPALLISDDYRTENKVLGVHCLHHIVLNVVSHKPSIFSQRLMTWILKSV